MMRTAVGQSIGLVLFCLSAATPSLAETTVFDGARLLIDGRQTIEVGRVVVVDGTIAAVGPATEIDIPEDATRIDGRGKTLMPGLADMHAHYFDSTEGVVYLANSITRVRNMAGAGVENGLDTMAREGWIAGPRVYSAAPLIDGKEPVRPGTSVVALNADQAIGAVRAAEQARYPAIKLYEKLDAETFRAAVTEAKALEMKVFAHTPASLDVVDLLDLRVDSIEHLDGYAKLLARDGTQPENTRFPDQEYWLALDAEKLEAVAEQTRAVGVWNAPTFSLLLARPEAADPEAFFLRPEAQYLAPWMRQSWSRSSWIKYYLAGNAQELRSQMQLVKALYDAGAPLLVGTDSPNPFVIPGFAIHGEIAAFVEAGIPAEDVLRIATAEAARFLDEVGEHGTIVPGAEADLVLLDGDPREQLDLLRDPAGVMLHGHWRDRRELQRELALRRERVNKRETPDNEPKP